MRRARGLRSKIARLEKQTGINKLPQIPLQDCIHIFEHKKGEPKEEIDAEIERRRAKLLEKYGQRILRVLQFIVIHIPISEDEEVSNDP